MSPTTSPASPAFSPPKEPQNEGRRLDDSGRQGESDRHTGEYDDRVKTEALFENAFEVKGLEPVEGLPRTSAQPASGEGAGEKAHMHSVYAELSYLLLQSDE